MTPPIPAPNIANLAYGPRPRHQLDLWLAADRPSPVVIFAHGGGWRQGSKDDVGWDFSLPKCLAAGISVASINYRFSVEAPAPGPMFDTARAVQFVRLHAAEWGIDPSRIALSGGSAGAVNALWVAFREDLAAPNDPDPIARQSTRVSGVYAINSPTFLDPKSLIEHRLGDALDHPAVELLTGLGPGGLKDPRADQILRAVSPLYLATAAAPPVHLLYTRRNVDLAEHNPGHAIHHPRFGVMLKRRLDELGVPCGYACRDDYPDLDDKQFAECWPSEPVAFLAELFEKHS
jgi:acetyl esterase/lipase